MAFQSPSDSLTGSDSGMNGRSEALATIAKLLSTSLLDTEKDREISPVTACARVSVPGLSLKHTKDHGNPSCLSSSQDRQEAEKRAVSLLERPLEELRETLMLSSNSIAAAKALLQNVYSAFAVLVDSRLHAYAAFLARHALSLEKKQSGKSGESSSKKIATVRGIEEKLTTILSTGAQVDADSIVTRFYVEDEKISFDDGKSTSSPLSFTISMDLTIPRPKGKKESVSVTFATSGTITGTFSSANEMETVEISLDTQHLLNQMVQHASRIVSAVVEIASNSCNGKQNQMHRSASFLAMPPPSLPVHHKNTKEEGPPARLVSFLNETPVGLDLLSQAASEMPIVSPDLSGDWQPELSIPSFDLQSEDDDDISHLSADQCADIVDTCLFGGDLDKSPERPSKRAKIFN